MNLVRSFFAVAAVLLVLGGGLSVATAASTGYVAYSFQFSHQGVTKSFNLNETVSATSSSGADSVLLKLSSESLNVSYSRSVNSSLLLFPYLPPITNQTFSYSRNSTSITASVVQNGTASVSFQGASYHLTTYTVSAQLSSKNGSGSVEASLASFPSGLLYSAKGRVNGTSTFAILLTATSLPLDAASSSTAAQVASVTIGGGAVVGALALSLGVRSKRKHRAQGESKPDYWVD